MQLFWVASLTSCFFHGTSILLERTTNYGFFQTWVFSRDFLKNKPNKPVTLWKTKDQFIANDKIWAFMCKLEFWKACNCHCEFHSFSILKTFLKSLVLILVIFFDMVKLNVSMFRRSIQLSRPIYSQWVIHDVINSPVGKRSI